MLIEIHAIQNHSPGNLNRDDLGAPKTCYFGGVMRSRISSQCIKRSIRTSEQFKLLCGGIRTRQLARLVADKVTGKGDVKKRAAKLLEKCGIAPKDENKSDMLVYTTQEAIGKIAQLLQDHDGETDQLAEQCGRLISSLVAAPDMALAGRMLETGVLTDTTVEAALQVAHAISTHEARPEVDYYVAADDIPGEDAGAGYVDEAMFASACFYKYFSIHWETLLKNLAGFPGNKEFLAAHTVGAFLRGAALANPTGKQNSFAAHNPPDGIIVEVKRSRCTPISYANAFASPVPSKGPRDLVSQSIAQLGQYVHDLDTGYGKDAKDKRFWFSPNLRYRLTYLNEKKDQSCADQNLKSLDELVAVVVKEIGFDWAEVQTVTVW
ncbi:MAG: type I-E CRISPR-associated protein Cas7/Cse4/CasC [Phycisphaerae bacterium]|nr:type I-E CRISPR-associated protein Cas7/Cse4/CasC [Phycisphaerae bacterium]